LSSHDKKAGPSVASGQITFPDPGLARTLFGERGSHLKVVEKEIGLRIHSRGTSLRLEGGPIEVDLAGRVLTGLYELLKDGYPIYSQDVDYAIRILSGGHDVQLRDIFLDTVFITGNKRVITPKA
jgi:phosphate starvation-inducible PhoH-like protein